MLVGVRGDLREVGDAQHLMMFRQPLESAADRLGDRAADAGVGFIEEQRHALIGGENQ